MHLLRTGDEPGARRALDRSWRADPFDVVTFNLLKMLDNLEQFVTVKEGDIILKMHRDEAPVLREYAMPLAQEALKTLSARYGFTPTGPILVEIFPNHDDFAVRNLGLPGMIGALGACFGRVVTMDSPTARAPGHRSAGRRRSGTRWRTSSRCRCRSSGSRAGSPKASRSTRRSKQRPEWGRDMEVTFARAMDRGKVLKLRDLNAGFTRPDTISLAYYQASLLVEHIVAHAKGRRRCNALVTSYRATASTTTRR